MIKFNNVCKTFSVKNKLFTAVSHVNLDIKENEIYGIIGFSGAGKSTLLRMGNLLEKPTEGTIAINDSILSDLSGKQLREARN
jgi:D-methionine transport system ATP-binding protein